MGHPNSIAWNPAISLLAFISAGDCGVFMSATASRGFSQISVSSMVDLSCTTESKICSVSFVIPFSDGLLVVDSHRLARFGVSVASLGGRYGNSVVFGPLVASYGRASLPTHLRYPTSLSIYEPYNRTHVAASSDPVFKTPYRIMTHVDGGKYAFLTDSGNDRLCVFNMTGSHQLDMMSCVSITSPLYSAIMFGPSWEPGISAANVFVTTSSRFVFKIDFSSLDASLSISGQLGLPCPGKGIAVLNGGIIGIVVKCDDNITSGIVAISISLHSSQMYIVEFFRAPKNIWLYGPILVTSPDITGQRNIITTGGYLDSISFSSLFITLALPRYITIIDRPSRALDFLNTCFNISSAIGPPRDLVAQACAIFNVSLSVVDSLYSKDNKFDYKIFAQIFFTPYKRVILSCASSANESGHNTSTESISLNTDDLPISTNGCLMIIIVTVFIL